LRAWESVAKVGADIGVIPNQHSKKWRFCLWEISVVYSKPLSFGEKRALVIDPPSAAFRKVAAQFL
jgi:hypothetical protein